MKKVKIKSYSPGELSNYFKMNGATIEVGGVTFSEENRNRNPKSKDSKFPPMANPNMNSNIFPPLKFTANITTQFPLRQLQGINSLNALSVL